MKSEKTEMVFGLEKMALVKEMWKKMLLEF